MPLVSTCSLKLSPKVIAKFICELALDLRFGLGFEDEPQKFNEPSVP